MRGKPAEQGRGAGHAGALLGDAWYVAGGGNNAAGCADMLALDLGGLGAAPLAWAPVATAEPRSAIASEGLSLLAAPAAGALVAFGGYNGRYHNTVQVFRPGAALGGVTHSTSFVVHGTQLSMCMEVATEQHWLAACCADGAAL